VTDPGTAVRLDSLFQDTSKLNTNHNPRVLLPRDSLTCSFHSSKHIEFIRTGLGSHIYQTTLPNESLPSLVTMNAPFLHLMSYAGSVLGFCFMTLSLASGLYYLAEFVEVCSIRRVKIVQGRY
jgi:hypothetical protein